MSYIALDENNKRIHISSAEKSGNYFCQSCHEKLTVRKGKIRRAHFAHQKGSDCALGDIDMSDWHYNWQNRFPIDNQERIFRDDNDVHRADIFLDQNRVVIEFQHSPISPEEFDKRSVFYTSQGFKVIWLFDACSAYDGSRIRKDKDGWYWSTPNPALKNFPYHRKDVEIYLQIMKKHDDDDRYKELKAKEARHGGTKLNSADWYYMFTHEKRDKSLIFQAHFDENRGSHYFDRGNDYDNESFVEHVLSLENVGFVVSDDNAYDTLQKLGFFNGVHYYSGCPLSKDNICCIPLIKEDNELSSYPVCPECPHTYEGDKCKGCRQRYNELNIPKNAHLRDVQKDDDDNLQEVIYEINGETIVKKFDPINKIIKGCDTIKNIWKKHHCNWYLIVRNYFTNEVWKITNNPTYTMAYYSGRVYGYPQEEERVFSKKSKKIEFADSNIWIYLYNK